MQNHTHLLHPSSSLRLPLFIFILPSHLSPLLLSLSYLNQLSLPSLQLFSFPSLPSCSFLPSFALPWWYLIAVKQEAGAQTAGEPTLILSCAICCGHMTELQTRSNTMMPHHTWHIDQSWPKSNRETESERGRVRMKRNHSNIKQCMSYEWNPANYDSIYYLVLTLNFGISSGLFSMIKADCSCSINLVKIWSVVSGKNNANKTNNVPSLID